MLKMKVLITGAAGWLGCRVVDALIESAMDVPLEASGIAALVPAGEPTRALLDRGVEVVVGDIRDDMARKSFLQGASGAVLLHLAGIIHPAGRTYVFEDVNHLGTVALCDAARTAGVGRMVAMSSNSAFGANPANDHLFDEDSPFNPYMGYGRSKMHMEQALRARAKASSDMEIVVVRAPWFYGPGQPPRQTAFFSMIKNCKFPIVGSGENRRSMGYVDNLAQGILCAACTEGVHGEAFWLADARPYSMNEIVSTVEKVLRDDFGMAVKGKTPRVPGIISDVARIADSSLQALGFYHQKIHVLSEMNLTISCSVEKARARLGYDPSVELHEGMRCSIEWCLNEKIPI